jgi:drug/metabolite transporter (DMT)-like permease
MELILTLLLEGLTWLNSQARELFFYQPLVLWGLLLQIFLSIFLFILLARSKPYLWTGVILLLFIVFVGVISSQSFWLTIIALLPLALSELVNRWYRIFLKIIAIFLALVTGNLLLSQVILWLLLTSAYRQIGKLQRENKELV